MSGRTQPAAVLQVPTNEALRRRRAGSVAIEANPDLCGYLFTRNSIQSNPIQFSYLHSFMYTIIAFKGRSDKGGVTSTGEDRDNRF